MYKNSDGTGLIPYSDTERKFIEINDSRVQRQAMQSVEDLLADSGRDVDTYAAMATGGDQRVLLGDAIRPQGNSPSREDILKWLASSDSSSSSNNKWPSDVLR